MKRVRADATGIKKIEMDGYRGGGGGVFSRMFSRMLRCDGVLH